MADRDVCGRFHANESTLYSASLARVADIAGECVGEFGFHLVEVERLEEVEQEIAAAHAIRAGSQVSKRAISIKALKPEAKICHSRSLRGFQAASAFRPSLAIAGAECRADALPRRPTRARTEEATIVTPTLMKPIVTKFSCQG